MPGQSTAVALPSPGVAVAGKLVLLDARPPARAFGPEQQREALEKLERKAGPATAAIEVAVATAFDALRAELNDLAGGQASARVMIMVRNAELTQLAAELQASISRGAHGGYVEEADEGQTEKGLRNLAGICAVANDLLTKATDVAREEGKARQATGPVGQLMDRLGVQAHGSGVTRVAGDPGPGPVPDARGGGTLVEAPPELNHTPVPGGSK